MTGDTKRLIVVAFVLLIILAAVAGRWKYRQAHRPVLTGVRVVTATVADPTFRDGARHLAPGEGFTLAVALHVTRPGKGDIWVCPGHKLMLQGRAIPHVVSSRWPDKGRSIRVFWSTIESNFVGGEMTAKNAAKRLAYRTFLAPEYGRSMEVQGRIKAHNTDFLAQLPPPPKPAPGTVRFFARVEVYAHPTDLSPIQAASSLGPSHLWDPRLPVISRGIQAPRGIHPEAGELFLLPGMEPMATPPSEWNLLTVKPLGKPFLDLVRARLVTSSLTFASMAVSGRPALDSARLRSLGRIRIAPGKLHRGGRPLRWGHEIRSGDLFKNGNHWMVAFEDDGNGWLDVNDTVIDAWKSPAEEVSLLNAIDVGVTSVWQFRYEGD
ncbi:MAG: hypothetical protein GXP48_08700 [Acidobacteria bacterium]|nr:hypothetical protein [Acidobacteriota bacterium]